MKILLISMPSIHVIRWVENLKQTGHDLYWFDVMGRGALETDVINEGKQFVGWKNRKVKYIKGEFLLSKIYPELYDKLLPLLEVTAAEKLENIINTIKPDVIHSFEMQSCCYPILKTMNKFPKLKWIYSCWGSDLFYHRQFSLRQKRIEKVLKRVDYLFTDCNRDYQIAKELGFQGKFLGVIPGGGGFKMEEIKIFSLPFKMRKTIIVKGYEHKFGRGLNVIKALELIQNKIIGYEVKVFGAHSDIINYINDKSLNFIYFKRNELAHQSILKLMGESLIYIGNSISDGIPNTLLESITMQAFPIQSNPGRATEEYIKSQKNGLLINNANSIIEIRNQVSCALDNFEMMEKAYESNSELAKEWLEYNVVNKKIKRIYNNIENSINNTK
ncbi:glycosyltransferase [Bizionia paragorgiae]|uniref:glycosyltransferase n=1 Tax=Bizionia paragorgiae TaxID=283786 RepID=UPI003A959892